MKNRKVWSLLLLILVISSSCKSLQGQKSKEVVSLYLNGKEIPLTASSRVKVGNNPFAIRFYNQKYHAATKEFYATQIAAFIDKSQLDKVNVGMNTEAIPFFTPGSGMAPYESGKYDFLIFNEYGHHYLMYDNKDSKRVNLLSDEGKYQKVEFEISGLYYEAMDVPMTETALKEYYLAIFIDRNLNDIIENNELYKLTVIIK